MAAKSTNPKNPKKASPKKAKPPAVAPVVVTILRNRKVRHDYEILETYEAGMVLVGSEVKSLRASDVQWADAHGRLDDVGELWLYGLYIGEYRQAGPFNHQPAQRRKLLLNRRELNKLAGSLQAKGLTVMPTQMYFKGGRAKCEIAVCRGKKHHDKRQDLIKRSSQREIQREMRQRLKQ